MMELWPFTNFHDLNLDWIIKLVKEMKYRLDTWTETLKEVTEEVLTEHPEWTTTVQDGSIDSNKLAPALANRILNNILTKYPLYGRGNTATGILLSNDPNAAAPIAYTDSVLSTNLYRTRRDSTSLTGIYQNVTATTVNTVTVTDNLENELKVGMYVFLYTQTPDIDDNYICFGELTGWNAQVLTVDHWENKNGQTITPSSVTCAVVNGKSRMYNNFSALHLKDPQLGGPKWTREMIGNQTEFYVDLPEPAGFVGYDAVIRENDNDASNIAFRARDGGVKPWWRVFHVAGDAIRILSHNGRTIINGNDEYSLPYVTNTTANDYFSDAAPIILTYGENVDMDATLENLATTAKFTIVNNSGVKVTLSGTDTEFRISGSASHPVKTFKLEAYETVTVYSPYAGATQVYLITKPCYVPGDEIAIPTAWYQIACQSTGANQFTIPLPKSTTNITSATFSGTVAVRANGTNYTSPTDVTDTSVYPSVSVTIADGFVVVNLGITSGSYSGNTAGIAYLQGCKITLA